MPSPFLAPFPKPKFLLALILAMLIHGAIIFGVSSTLSEKPESRIAVLQAVLIPEVRKVAAVEQLQAAPAATLVATPPASPVEAVPVPAVSSRPAPARPAPLDEAQPDGVAMQEQAARPRGCLSPLEAAQRANEAATAEGDLRRPCEEG